MNRHIYPIHGKSVQRSEKEFLLKQKGRVFWLTGLSGSGKSTLALRAERALVEEGTLVALLDGDNVRNGLCSNLGFSREDREENIRRIAEVAKILTNNGLVVLCTFISPGEEMRERARQIIGSEDFYLVYVKASVDTCMDRDPKGLYHKAISGEIKGFTGVSAPYDIPGHPDLILDTEKGSIDENSRTLLSYIQKNIIWE